MTATLNVFGVAGGGLGFAGRRMETIARVAFVPVALILMFDYATAFLVVSVPRGALLTSAELPAGATLNDVNQAAASIVNFGALVLLGLQEKPAMWGTEVAPRVVGLAAGSALLTLAVAASFMAPLIRLAGLGERPAPGLLRAPFGASQARYVLAHFVSLLPLAAVLAPSLVAVNFIGRAIDAAMSKGYALFPNPDSLHTIELVSPEAALTARGEFWLVSYGYLAYLAAIGAFVLFLVAMGHFGAGNRPNIGSPRPMQRAVFLAGATLFIVAVFTVFSLGGLAGEASQGQISFRAFAVGLIILVAYASLRFAPYPGVVACSGSMRPTGLFELSRGWNLFRLAGVFFVVWLVIIGVQIFVEGLILPSLSAGLNSLLTASDSLSRISNGGERPEWVTPVFVWAWAGVLIVYKFVWLFFTYGVSAGVLGRLYRESAEAS
ncbi:MAG: hypothetical protein AAFX08_03045 [Pseudomonadota bacterium]